MACPERKKDARIIAEYNRRKLALENTEIITVTNILEGDIFSIIHTIDLNKTESIVKVSDNSWEVKVLI